MTEKELLEREKQLEAREKAVEKRERALDPLSQAVHNKKQEWYSHVKLTVKQMDVIIWIIVALLVIVFILMILEATGVYKLPL